MLGRNVMNRNRQTILIVEDEPAIAENIVFAVNTENMTALSAATAEAAETLLKQHPVDLIVLDVGLPDRNGFDFCRALRARSDVPVIFLTARKEEIDRVAGLELGADDYLTKPFSPRELTARIRAVLRRARNGQTAGPAACPDFQLDSDRKQICYRGQRLDLSRYEYRILKLLLEHPGRVFSRDQLMESVWEDPLASLDRTVDTHMKTLRAKLRQIDPQADCLQTRRGLGYCLKESA